MFVPSPIPDPGDESTLLHARTHILTEDGARFLEKDRAGGLSVTREFGVEVGFARWKRLPGAEVRRFFREDRGGAC